jgi:hypothetical protein
MLENNINIDLRKMGLGGTDWINLSQNGDQRRALVNTTPIESFRF